MKEHHKNLLTGIFVVASCILIVTVILFLEPQVGDGKKTMHVRLSNVSKIYVGTRVSYGGRPVGEVIAIETIPDAREEKTDHLGRLYFYDLTLKVDSSVDVYSCDQICIQTAGLLGDKSIAIVPKPARKGSKPYLVNDKVLYGDALDPLEAAFHEMSTVSQKMQNTMNEVNIWMQNFADDTGKALQNFGASMGRLDQVLGTLQDGDFLDKTQSCVRNLSIISEKISKGEGSIGKLLEDQNLFLRLDNLVSKANILMDDVNHYGVLFHTNRGWQRLRAQRMNQLASVHSPKAVTALLSQELNDINLAMARLQTIAESVDKNPEEKQKFQQVYLELKSNAKNLLDNIQLMTQSLAE
jgi:phospholipid/cholesterol/gamma-HCH transport system substrate-binding protein